MQPFDPHSRFFSSLKQVEDRLASEARACSGSKTRTPFDAHLLSSPIFLDLPSPDAGGTDPQPSHLQDSSGPPLNFLSSSSCPQAEPGQAGEEHRNLPPAESDAGSDDADPTHDIEQLMSLLGVTASEDCSGGGGAGSSCDCSGGGFYSKVAGVRGPKCGRERRRLDGWIEHYRKKKTEPARLGHLLLAKAWFSSGGDEEEDGDGHGGIEFPVTVEEFLEHDTPADEQRQAD